MREHYLSESAHNALRNAPVHKFKDGTIEIDATYRIVVDGKKVKHTFVLIEAPKRHNNEGYGYRDGLVVFANAIVGYKVLGVWLASNNFGNTSVNQITRPKLHGLRDVGTVYDPERLVDSLCKINKSGRDLIIELLHNVTELTDSSNNAIGIEKPKSDKLSTLVDSIKEVGGLFIQMFQALEKTRLAKKPLTRHDIDTGSASLQALRYLFDEYVKSTGAKLSTVEIMLRDVNVSESKKESTK